MSGNEGRPHPSSEDKLAMEACRVQSLKRMILHKVTWNRQAVRVWIAVSSGVPGRNNRYFEYLRFGAAACSTFLHGQ